MALAIEDGRWLRGDTTERKARYIQFDFDALERRALELCPGATCITACEKKEGGYNRVFIFSTNDEQRVVARLPFAVAGPPRLRTSSEVATIEYLRTKTSIPIPKILDWSDDVANPIGSEYIIVEHAPGVSLCEKWLHMDVGDQIKCIHAIYEKLQGAVDLTFPAYGSIYFADTSYVTGSTLPLDTDFCIGPHSARRYWNCDAGQDRSYHQVAPNQGPCKLIKGRHPSAVADLAIGNDLVAYVNGLVDTGISRIPTEEPYPERPNYHGSIETHHELLEHSQVVIKAMIEHTVLQNTASPILFHPDLHTRNIFVSEKDPKIVTAIIDWQSASIEPAFWYRSETPDFAQPHPDPSNEERIERKSEACAKVDNMCLQVYAPRLAETKLMDEAYFRLFRYCHRTWTDGAAAFRDELIQTSRRWKELGYTGTCPFPMPGLEELASHKKDFSMFTASLHLRKVLPEALNAELDGWVPTDLYEAAEAAQKEMYQMLLQEVLQGEHDEDEPLRDESDVRQVWPYDLEKDTPGEKET
ncbi:hypothetical protein NX059_003159 [Plenodomus lindquistii]|nr:hypothetical protein NX059_003159 [Plenodomus lindquistii]